MIDLSFHKLKMYYDDKTYSIEIQGIRLNSFGAHLLGIKSDYVPKPKKETESGLVVTPDFYVMITGKKAILEHSPFLSAFFAQNRGSGESVSYKIDMPGLFKALDQGTSGEAVMERLKEASSKPIPDNVLRTWESWIEKSKKIRIREVTLIEMDDKQWLSEWGGKAREDGLLFEPIGKMAAEISREDIKKVKRLLEKDGKYVDVKI
jgi:hypothetical protein